MRTKLLLLGLMLLPSGGCSCMNNTERGLVGGGLIGGALGTVVGAAVGRPGAGAAIGAGLGAGVGGLEGSAQDRSDRQYAKQVAAVQAQAARNQMTITDVVQLSQRGMSENIIIRQIESTGSVFRLTTEDLNFLHDQRVSPNVISAMQSRTPRPVVVHPQPVVVYERYPPPPPLPPPGVGFGVTVIR